MSHQQTLVYFALKESTTRALKRCVRERGLAEIYDSLHKPLELLFI
jgi:hypothetical protein